MALQGWGCTFLTVVHFTVKAIQSIALDLVRVPRKLQSDKYCNTSPSYMKDDQTKASTHLNFFKFRIEKLVTTNFALDDSENMKHNTNDQAFVITFLSYVTIRAPMHQMQDTSVFVETSTHWVWTENEVQFWFHTDAYQIENSQQWKHDVNHKNCGTKPAELVTWKMNSPQLLGAVRAEGPPATERALQCGECLPTSELHEKIVLSHGLRSDLRCTQTEILNDYTLGAIWYSQMDKFKMR